MLTLFLSNLIAGGKIECSSCKDQQKYRGYVFGVWGHFHRDSAHIFNEDIGYLHNAYVASFIEESETISKAFNEHSFLRR